MTTADGSVGATTQFYGSALRSRALNIVLVGDGFTSTQQDTFNTACTTFITTLLATKPFDVLGATINAFRVNVTSTDSGADDPASAGGTGATVNTYFDASFGSGGLRRALTSNTTLALQVATTAVPEASVVMVLVNSTIYGGTGYAGGAVVRPATFSLNSQSAEIGVHELGHSGFGLADEYAYLAGPPETGHDRYSAGEPTQPNVTIDTDRATLKWAWAVNAATALPTMSNPDATAKTEDLRPSTAPDGTIGLFEGADYFHSGAYRPEYNCKMRQLAADYCHICSAVITAKLGPLQVVPGGDFRQLFAAEDDVVYAVAGNGDLLWYHHDGRPDGTFRWSDDSPRRVGVGWDGLQKVFNGGGGVLYGIDDAGDLLWYRHDGRLDGTFRWAAGSGNKVGTGWGGLRQVFSGGGGVLYGINASGDLLWYHHDGYTDGSFRWANNSSSKVGTGWNTLTTVFSGGGGVIYGVDEKSELLWYRHDGYTDGTFRWATEAGRVVGTGWGTLSAVFAPGDGSGVIYSLDGDRNLLWYRHDGRADGSFTWAPGSSNKVGTGWSLVADGLLYGVDSGGRLLWYRHEGWTDGSFRWADGSPRQVGTGWGQFARLFSGGDGVLYGITRAGDLLWYRHEGNNDGSFRWAPGGGNKVGTGWGSFAHVFSGGDGVLYTIDGQGNLLWYHHDGRFDGSFTWAQAAGRVVGTGWGQFTQVFAGHDGVIYAVEASGNLLWFRHDGRGDGSFTWATPAGKQVGTGWNGLQHLVSGNDGVIYGENSSGDLQWYRHDGRVDGSFAWAPGSGQKVGTGWNGLAQLTSGS